MEIKQPEIWYFISVDDTYSYAFKKRSFLSYITLCFAVLESNSFKKKKLFRTFLHNNTCITLINNSRSLSYEELEKFLL